MEQVRDPKVLMEEGWEARESYEFEKAEKLLNGAKELFEKQSDWKNVTECLNHLAYLYNVKAFDEGQKAISVARQSLEIVKENKLDPTLCNRANATVLKTAGEFEQAEEFARALVSSFENNSTARGDARGSLANILMRRGKLTEAKREIDAAFEELNEGWEQERMPHKMIWKTKLLMTSALINYNLENVADAKLQAAEARSLAQEHNLKMRLEEAEELLKLFN